MLYIILFLISIAGGYVAFRYISLLRALKQIQKELDVIQQDLSQKSDDTSSRSEQSVKGTSHHNQLLF